MALVPREPKEMKHLRDLFDEFFDFEIMPQGRRLRKKWLEGGGMVSAGRCDR
jgi:HSP20 family protein